jgi:hypothetical protein
MPVRTITTNPATRGGATAKRTWKRTVREKAGLTG